MKPHAPKIKATSKVASIERSNFFKKSTVDIMNKFLDADTRPLDIGKMLKERGTRMKITTTGIRKKDMSLIPLNKNSDFSILNPINGATNL